MQTLKFWAVMLCLETQILCFYDRFAIFRAFWNVSPMQKCQHRRVADRGWHDTRGAVATALRGGIRARDARMSRGHRLLASPWTLRRALLLQF